MANALLAKAIDQRFLAKDLSKAANDLSFQTIVLVSQVNAHPEMATAPKASARPDNLTTADLAQKANDPQETLRHGLPANMTRVLPVITSLAHHVVTTMTSNPAPMRTLAPKAVSMPLATKPKVAVNANQIPHAPAST